jgi:hypothetical protein
MIQPRDIFARTIAALEVLGGKRARIHTPKQPGNILYFWKISFRYFAAAGIGLAVRAS